MEFIEFNLCKHRKKVRSSQVFISINSCTELRKTQFYPVSIVNCRKLPFLSFLVCWVYFFSLSEYNE